MSSQAITVSANINGFESTLYLDVDYYVDKNIVHHPNGYDSKTEYFITLVHTNLIDVESEQIPSIAEVNKWIKLNESLIIEQIEL